MSLVVMCSETDPGAYCVLNPGYGDSFSKERPLIMHETHKGMVLGTGEYNGYDDSDFYAEVWNDEKAVIEKVIYATTRGWSYPNGALVDATPEVLDKAREYRRKIHLGNWTSLNRGRAEKPAFGKRVKVVRGRKIPKGTEGEVFWGPKDSKFGYRTTSRIGIRLDDGERLFTATTNVEVMFPERYMEPEANGEKYASYMAAGEYPAVA